MNTSARPWWKRRFILFPSIGILLLLAALAIALVRSDTSQIVIYNNTGAAIGPLTVRACGQDATFRQIPDETSVRFRLHRGGSASGVELETPEEKWHWEGSYLESHGGYVVFIHLRRGMEVETNTQLSIWQQILPGFGGEN